MKRTAIVRRTPLRSTSTPARSKPLPTVSTKRAAQNRTYSALRRDFPAAWPRCRFPNGCDQPATTIQHLRGRRGERLNDTAWWAASCVACNLWAEDHTGEALAIGWLVRIESVA